MEEDRFTVVFQPTSASGHPSKGTLLLIHPKAESQQEYTALLEQQGYEVLVCDDALTGLDTIYRTIPDLILADIVLSEMNGYQLCRLMKNDPVMQKIPFILVSHGDEKINKFWSFKAGADSFIRYEEVSERLLKEVQMLLEIYDRIEVGEKQRLAAEHPLGTYNVRTRLNQILDKALIEASLMNEFRNFSNLIHDKTLLNYMLFSFLETVLDYDLAAIFYNDKTRDPRVVTFNLAEGQQAPSGTFEKLKADFFAPLKRLDTTPHRFELLEHDVIGDIQEEAPAASFQTVYHHPFFLENELIGTLALYAKAEVDYEKIFPFSIILDEIKLLMKLRNLYSQAEMLSVTDGLTGLFNYRHFTHILEREFRRAKRYGIELSMAILDIDEFQKFNERSGHALGDEVLKHIATIATETFRGIDYIGRYSGDELVVLFPETPLESAQQACERFQENLRKTPLRWIEEDLLPTVSLGIMTVGDDIETTSQFLNRAKAAVPPLLPTAQPPR